MGMVYIPSLSAGLKIRAFKQQGTDLLLPGFNTLDLYK